MLKKCKCKHSHQDKLHGEKVRVMNPTTQKKGDKQVYRCTVCLAEHT